MRRFALVLAAGCSLGIGFDMPFDVPQLTIAGNPAAHAAAKPLSGAVAPFALSVDLSQAEKQNDMAGVIHTVTLESAVFTITNASGCFDFVDYVSFTIESTKPGTTLPPAVLATGAGPGCVQTFTLTPTSIDIKPYLDEGATVSATASGVPPETNVTLDGRVVLHATI